MPSQAPRIDSRLVAAIALFDDRAEPIAMTYRRVGRLSELLGIVRPSYQQVRVLADREIVAGILLGRRSAMALSEHAD